MNFLRLSAYIWQTEDRNRAEDGPSFWKQDYDENMYIELLQKVLLQALTNHGLKINVNVNLDCNRLNFQEISLMKSQSKVQSI